MSSFGRQFLLLLWKNYKLQSRRKLLTVFEIIIPLLLAIMLLVIRMLSTNYGEPAYTISDPIEVPANPYWSKNRILYSPKNTFTTNIISYVSLNYKQQGTLNMTGFDTENELLDFYNTNSDDVIAGVVFVSDTEKTPLSSMDYKLRLPTYWGDWFTESTYQLIGDGGLRSEGPNYEDDFLNLQYYINKAFTIMFKPDAFNDVKVFTKKMAYPPFTRNSITVILKFMLALFILFSFILNVPQMAKNIAYEKEHKLRESMKMMGLRTSVYWLSWFVKNFIYLLLVVTLYTIICFINTENGRLFQHTEPTLFFVFLLLYIMATIAFSFMISTFFKKANSAAFAAGILYFLTFTPEFFLDGFYESMTRSQKMGTCILHNMGMAFGIETILIAETAGEGYNWSNFHLPGQIGDDLSLLDTMGMLVIDTVLYMFIAWYVDTVNPGEAGVPQPLWFPFSPKFWCGSNTVDVGYENMSDSENEKNFERDRSGAKIGISVQHLRKRFGSNIAVNDVTLSMYEGQITALLGHNGAGKTTTISMLTGFMKPSGGTATVDGKDIRSNMDDIRKNIGLCPQHNILFDTLTVEEHLIFFAKLKGCPRENVDREVNDMIRDLGLEQKRHAFASTLSGGQKRKLSVGIALVAGSKIVILDEPSSGMDPAARRHMWDILQRYRAGRTIILTTHFMDEADILGDRIAIMAHGSLKCCGTSMFLKKLYGAGYHLVVVKDSHCDIDRLSQLIKTFIPTANIESQISSEISFLLPFNESEKFEGLFNEIEAKMTELGISSFGTSATTMEEVFLSVGEGASKEEEQVVKNRSMQLRDSSEHAELASNLVEPDNIVMVELENTNYISFNEDIKKNEGHWLTLQQCYATFVKKFIHTRRNLAISIAQLLLPIVFAILALSIIKANIDNDSSSSFLALDLHPFPKYIVSYSAGQTEDQQTTELAMQYKDQFDGETTKVDRNTFPTMDDFFKQAITSVGLPTFSKEYIIAGDFDNSSDQMSLIAHYNGQPYHSIAISLQYAMNGFLKYVTKDKTKQINVRNHPLPKVTDSDTDGSYGTALAVAILVVFGMAFMTGTFSMFYIKERSIGAKHLQVVSGVGPITYWMASFAWDVLNYIIPALIILIVFAAFQVSVYSDRLGYVFFVLILYGWSVLPFVYLLQHMFSKPATGLILISLINILTGLIFMTLIMITIQLPKAKSAGETMEWIFLIFFPNYNLGNSLMNMFFIGQLCTYGCFGRDNCCPNVLDMERPAIGRECLFMFLQGVFYMFMVLCIELGLFHRLFQASMQKAAQGHLQQAYDLQPDSDVSAESHRINSTPIQNLMQTDSLILKNVSKVYNTGFQAVKNVSCGIQANECFGLLGQNGAGKSTTFKMLTGEEIITSGDAFLKQLSLKSDLKEVHRSMGYCPQFDALIDQMTGRETLYMYARLRGIKQSDIPVTVNQLVDVLMLNEHIDKKTSHYSGGNKRKLSTAISLIGDPPFIFLDEPTTGLDPAARRQLWNVIAGVRASGRTVVLISHSMEECDALCTKLVIMVNGNFVCLGSPQHLKNKFGHGYTLFCRMGLDQAGFTASSQPLAQYVQNTFQGATVFDDNTGYVHFKIPDDNARLGQIFGMMEALKKQYNVEDYSVHQTSLEQIFLMFVQNQIPPAVSKPSCCVRCGCLCFTMCC